MKNANSNLEIISLQKLLSKFNKNINNNLIVKSKIKNIQNLTKNKKKICKVGINTCYTLLLMLQVNPTAKYLLFDSNKYPYTKTCLKFIHKMYPNAKIKIIYGDLSKTIPEYIKNHKKEHETYDLCRIDEAYINDIFSVDYNNIRILTKQNTPVIFNDYNVYQVNNNNTKQIPFIISILPFILSLICFIVILILKLTN